MGVFLIVSCHLHRLPVGVLLTEQARNDTCHPTQICSLTQRFASRFDVAQMSEFTIGQTVLHKKFDYRGVIVGVDEAFQGDDTWYDVVARSRPPKDKPWYHVLVHETAHRTYVAERHLAPDPSGLPVEHPEVAYFFDQFRAGFYSDSRSLH